jgi:hypothetical protein
MQVLQNSQPDIEPLSGLTDELPLFLRSLETTE